MQFRHFLYFSLLFTFIILIKIFSFSHIVFHFIKWFIFHCSWFYLLLLSNIFCFWFLLLNLWISTSYCFFPFNISFILLILSLLSLFHLFLYYLCWLLIFPKYSFLQTNSLSFSLLYPLVKPCIFILFLNYVDFQFLFLCELSFFSFFTFLAFFTWSSFIHNFFLLFNFLLILSFFYYTIIFCPTQTPFSSLLGRTLVYSLLIFHSLFQELFPHFLSFFLFCEFPFFFQLSKIGSFFFLFVSLPSLFFEFFQQ